MLFDFGNVLVFLVVGIGFVLASLLVGSLLRPKAPFREKLMTYECGEIPNEGGQIRFNIRFYILALVFIIFDVEIALMLPVGVVYKGWIEKGQGLLALAEIGLFVLILLLGLVYVWAKKDLEWVKGFVIEDKNIGLQTVPRSSKLP